MEEKKKKRERKNLGYNLTKQEKNQGKTSCVMGTRNAKKKRQNKRLPCPANLQYSSYLMMAKPGADTHTSHLGHHCFVFRQDIHHLSATPRALTHTEQRIKQTGQNIKQP